MKQLSLIQRQERAMLITLSPVTPDRAALVGLSIDPLCLGSNQYGVTQSGEVLRLGELRDLEPLVITHNRSVDASAALDPHNVAAAVMHAQAGLGKGDA